MTLVACFGKIPRFCRFELVLETFELRSSLIESISESPSSELLHGDNWSAESIEHNLSNKNKQKEEFVFRKYTVQSVTYLHKDQLAACIRFD